MPQDCILFDGHIKQDGYGQVWSRLHKRSIGAHRAVYENKYGVVLKGFVVMHLCDNRSCVNLNHLRMGTQAENIRDMHKKGRWCDRKGEKHPLAKLTNNIVHCIIDLYQIDGLTQIEIANIFEINQGTVSRLINKKRWNCAFS